MDISLLVEQPQSALLPDDGSQSKTSERTSVESSGMVLTASFPDGASNNSPTTSRGGEHDPTGLAQPSRMTTMKTTTTMPTTPAFISRRSTENNHSRNLCYPPPRHSFMRTVQYGQGYPPPEYLPVGEHSSHAPTSGPDPRLLHPKAPFREPRVSKKHLTNKQLKWTADDDKLIIALRANGSRWRDISKNLPGRGATSCRLRFQKYLERRIEWDEEKKNKLARLYARCKKDMWEKISKQMQVPWWAAEAMHWQIGEVEMARRADVANQGTVDYTQGGMGSEGRSSISPTGGPHASGLSYTDQHNHLLPRLPHAFAQSLPGSGAPTTHQSILGLQPHASFLLTG